jgi:hypothetical protein
MKFESTLEHFGRVFLDGGRAPFSVEIFNDSLRLRETHPFRVSVFMSRDTLYAESLQKHGASHTGDDGGAEMLECLFEGPAVSLSPGAGFSGTRIDHHKSQCAGGLYKRLDLPAVMRTMVLQVHQDRRRAGASWSDSAACPSFAGLGLSPRARVDLAIEGDDDSSGMLTLVFSCETNLGNTTTEMPNGETASIVGGRYRLMGRMAVQEESWLCVGGSFSVVESMSYVRPALSPTVLEKKCETNVSLSVRWDAR